MENEIQISINLEELNAWKLFNEMTNKGERTLADYSVSKLIPEIISDFLGRDYRIDDNKKIEIVKKYGLKTLFFDCYSLVYYANICIGTVNSEFIEEERRIIYKFKKSNRLNPKYV